MKEPPTELAVSCLQVDGDRIYALEPETLSTEVSGQLRTVAVSVSSHLGGEVVALTHRLLVDISNAKEEMGEVEAVTSPTEKVFFAISNLTRVDGDQVQPSYEDKVPV